MIELIKESKIIKSIDALFISDVHLGSKGSKAEKLLEVLKQYKPKELYIVGDFIDGWLLKKKTLLASISYKYNKKNIILFKK